MYDKYVIQYVVTAYDKEDKISCRLIFTNEEEAVINARNLKKEYSKVNIIVDSELTGWEE